MTQLVAFDSDDARQDIAGEKSEAVLSLPSARIPLTPKEESQLWLKVDLRLMPIIALMYLLCFLDRGNAKLDGLMTQLKLDGNQYNIALVSLRVAQEDHLEYQLACSILCSFVMLRMLMGFVKNYPQLAGVRFCLGIAESGYYAGITYYLTMWYPKYMLQRRFAIFLGAATSAGAFSGILAYGINFMNGDGGYQGWSWIFILEGIATVVVGCVALLIMVDYPSTAKFLTPNEQQYIIQRRGQHLFPLQFSEVDEEGDLAAQVRAAITDWQVWAMCIVQLSITVPLYGITYFLPFGYSTSASQLLSAPPYVFGVIVLLVVAYFSDKTQLRSPFIFATQTIAILGFIINITNAPYGVKYFGTYLCVAGPYTGGAGSIIWLANNLEGKCKRAIGMAIVICMGNLGGAVASNIFRSQDAPRYILGLGIEIMFLVMGMIAVPIIALTYRRLNARKDTLERRAEVDGGDILNAKKRSFRYTL
ncbi:major facilitator superfamily domain-containing protein [Pisolithus croceorrhizus]|nr:major facilitator superfamily domain-containing protein [Pisolithus croceorrhizus]